MLALSLVSLIKKSVYSQIKVKEVWCELFCSFNIFLFFACSYIILLNNYGSIYLAWSTYFKASYKILMYRFILI